ncbi:MAG: hypothetical protein JWP63_5610 [Candidatus Solibacter sp.]|jgi:hypothetical protein|nr:hypothetical protein [Candidatus Solibacter sp.]
MKQLLALFMVCAATMFSQANTAQLSGSVIDPAGAAVPGAQIEAVNADTGAVLKTEANERGEWVLTAVPAATYRITVVAQGFRKLTIDDVQLNSAVPRSVTAKLELGSTTESIVVSDGAALVQTSSATVQSTVQQRQVSDLPFVSRGGMDLIVTQPGVQTTGTNRGSFVNGLPLAAINITTDGINTQDNYYKNGDGFFTVIPVRQDSVEEISLTTSAAGADANSQGAATIRFVTKSGTNEFHGGTFWQHRNTALNANSYFNNVNGLGRNKVILNQAGVHVGGPIIKNKLLFFTNLEIYRYPAQTSTTRVVMNPASFNGDYTYPVTGSTPRTINVLQLAQAAGYTSTVDPIIGTTLNQINGYTKNGLLQGRVASSNDYNRYNLLFQPKGLTRYWTDTTRLDYNITNKHTLSVIWTYYANNSSPDITNSVVPIFPGTGAVVGYDNLVPSQGGNRYAVSTSLRSSIKPTLTNEFRMGWNRAVTIFRGEVSSSSLFNQWKGYAPSLGFSLTGVASVTGSSRRSSPVRELHDTVSWQKQRHTISAGVDISQIGLWYQTVGNSVIPTIGFGVATGDPVNTGSSNLFTNANFPGASTTNLSEAGALYALLTGRVSSFGRGLAYDGQSYKPVPATERDRQYEWGTFVQDSWRASSSLTVTMGLRFERQLPFQNLDGSYSAVSYQSLWGVSGVGHLFQPGSKGGVVPTFDKYTQDYYKTPNAFNPSVGMALQLPADSGILGFLFGHEKGRSVLRAGYGINTVRNGSNTFQSLLGSNQGLNYDTSISPGSYPTDFGAPGSVLFRQSSFPTRSGVPGAPQYPFAVLPTNSINGYDPSLKMAYVQSWNIGFQRQIGRNSVIEVRYTGNHGLKAWRQINLNEVNVLENGFSKEFYQAQQNLYINRGCSGSWNNCSNAASNSFANAGLPGQGAVPLISTLLGTTNDLTTANNLRRNQVATLATTFSGNATYNARLNAAGYPSNYFVVNPAVYNGGSWLLTNSGSSNYNALQVEFNRRMTSGLLFQGSYVWSKSLVAGSQSSLVDASQPSTLRNTGLDRTYAGFDMRHALKFNSIYELPVGAGRRYLSSTPIVRKMLEGWQISGISRVQSGAPFNLSGRSTIFGSYSGVTLHNITLEQLTSQVKIRKVTGSDGIGQVYWLPDSLIANSQAAFEVNNKTWSDLDASKPYIGPALDNGALGATIFVRQPWQYHLDMAVNKRSKIGERATVEFQANFLDALNLTNFFLANGPTSASFGRTTSAYNDFSGSADPGARVIEFRLSVKF